MSSSVVLYICAAISGKESLLQWKPSIKPDTLGPKPFLL